MPLPLQKKQIYLISGVVLAIVALFMVKVYLDQQRRSIEETEAIKFKKLQANQSSVLIAKDNIPKGVMVDEGSFETKIMLNQYVQPGAVTNLNRIAGMVTIAPIVEGEQVTLSKFAYAKESGDLSQATPAGKRAVSIAVDSISALAGMLKAGDHVDVIAVIPQAIQGADGKNTTQLVTLPIFQNVLILAVGQQIGNLSKAETARFKRMEEKQETSPMITLALNPQEASLMAFVQEQGKIKLTLRSPADTKIEQVQPASWEALFMYVFPERAIKPPEKELKPEDYVEIYRGLNKERVLLPK